MRGNIASMLFASGISAMSPIGASYAQEDVQRRVQETFACPYKTVLKFPKDDPRRKDFRKFETCSVPLVIEPTNHPNIIRFSGEKGDQYFGFYPLNSGGASEHLGTTMKEAIKALAGREESEISSKKVDNNE